MLLYFMVFWVKLKYNIKFNNNIIKYTYSISLVWINEWIESPKSNLTHRCKKMTNSTSNFLLKIVFKFLFFSFLCTDNKVIKNNIKLIFST